MEPSDDELIERLQAHLMTIRRTAGWSGERLSNELGVTKQTISNLETGKTKMTKMHYLAIRSVFNHEIVVSGNEDLAKIIQLLIDYPSSGSSSESNSFADDEKEGPNDKTNIKRKSALLGASALTAAFVSASPVVATALSPLASRIVKMIKR